MMKKNGAKKIELSPDEEKKLLIASLMQEFDLIYKDEKDCQEKINSMLYPGGEYSCRDCMSKRIEHQYGERKVFCLDCKKVTSLTTNTFFHRVRSVRAYLAPIWMMEQGVILSASEIAQISDVVNSTGQHILKKISFAVKDKMDLLKTVLPSDFMRRVICKRSKETPKREHPDAEIRDARLSAFNAEDNTSIEISGGKNISGNLDSIEEEILKQLNFEEVRIETLQSETQISTAKLLPALMLLELKGLVDRLPGDLYRKSGFAEASTTSGFAEATISGSEQTASNSSSFQISKKNLKKTVRLIKDTFQGISRKYLQLYHAIIWIYVDRAKWKKEKLLKACCAHGDVRPTRIYSYVSPYVVRVELVV